MTAPEKTRGERWPVGSVWLRFDTRGQHPRVVLQHTASGLVFSECMDGAVVKWMSYRAWEIYAKQATRTDAGEVANAAAPAAPSPQPATPPGTP